jgi:hypothetical protein
MGCVMEKKMRGGLGMGEKKERGKSSGLAGGFWPQTA